MDEAWAKPVDVIAKTIYMRYPDAHPTSATLFRRAMDASEAVIAELEAAGYVISDNKPETEK